MSQVTENPSGDFKSMHRHISKGSWTFSDQDHGWQVSDCTAEGLKVATNIRYEQLRLLISFLMYVNKGTIVWCFSVVYFYHCCLQKLWGKRWNPKGYLILSISYYPFRQVMLNLFWYSFS